MTQNKAVEWMRRQAHRKNELMFRTLWIQLTDRAGKFDSDWWHDDPEHCVVIPGRKFRWDFRSQLDPQVLVDIHGGTFMQVGGHSYGESLADDWEKVNLAVFHGFRPFVFTDWMLHPDNAPRYFEPLIERLLVGS